MNLVIPTQNKGYWKRIAIGLSILFIFSLILLYNIQQGETKEDNLKYKTSVKRAKTTRFGLIVDLGNSGSRIRIYEYTYEPPKQGVPLDQHCTDISNSVKTIFAMPIDSNETTIPKTYSKKIWPGVGTFINNPAKVTDTLDELIKYAKNKIPKSHHDRTIAFIYATAGLRVIAKDLNERIYDDDDFDNNFIFEQDDDGYLEYKNTKVGKLLQTIKSHFQINSPFKILGDEYVRIIHGYEEGLFDYLSTQLILAQTHVPTMDIDINQPILNPKYNITERQNIGVIELGGGSVQIAYNTQDFTLASSLDVKIPSQIEENYIPVPIFITTYLQYGMYKMIDKYIWNLIQEEHGPFYPIGDKKDKAVDLITQAESVAKITKNPCMLIGTTDNVKLNDVSFPMIGTGDFELCKSKIRKLINKAPPCTNDKHHICTFEGTRIPKINDDIYLLAHDHFFRPVDFLGLRGYLSLSEIYQHTQKLCESKNGDLDLKNYGKETKVWKYQMCFGNTYVYELLTYGFGFPDDKVKLAFTDFIGTIEITWGLGGLINSLKDACHKHKLDEFFR
eukprot:TRINITY_DN1518_c0_g1_i1.p1 TRINITY_DN1518_c0_g1~~TRINITY_DN1518_c0_g1_i1.p1  ORF type:complete len:560 (-),score=122.10 TRINITY_DN1518_c0_g1_i1:29-1708(-)